jgi:hypothetical protein
VQIPRQRETKAGDPVRRSDWKGMMVDAPPSSCAGIVARIHVIERGRRQTRKNRLRNKSNPATGATTR